MNLSQYFRSYSKHLERWNEEWAHYSEKYLKEGTLKSSFDMLLEESRETSKVHSAIKERFNDEVSICCTKIFIKILQFTSHCQI
jgi:hypothetical protein